MIVTASPLVLDVVDDVALLAGGTVVARGRHRDLLDPHHPAAAAYRAVVSRASEDTDPAHSTSPDHDDTAHDTTAHDEGMEDRHEAARR